MFKSTLWQNKDVNLTAVSGRSNWNDTPELSYDATGVRGAVRRDWSVKTQSGNTLVRI